MSAKTGSSAPVKLSPSGLGAARLIAGLSLRRTRRGGLIWLPVVVLALLLLAAVVALVTGKAGVDFFKGSLDILLRYLIPFVMILHGSSAVGEEVQAKTITYLFSRPIPRWSLPLGKFAGNLGLGLLLLLPVTLLLYVLALLGELELFTTELPLLGRGLLAVVVAALLYGALGTAFGTMVTRGAFVVALVVWGVLDVAFGFIPGALKAVAMNVHLRVLTGQYVPDLSGFNKDPVLSTAVSLPLLLVVIALLLVLAVSWVSGTEYRTDK